MHSRFRFLSSAFSWFTALRPLLLTILLSALFSAIGARPSYASAPENMQVAQAQSSAPAATEPARAFASYVVLLDGEPLVPFYTALTSGEQVQAAAVMQATEAHLAAVNEAQMQLVETLASHDVQVLYRAQRVYDGVAIYAPVDQVAAIAALPGVQGVYPIIPKVPTNARIDQLLQMPAVWQGINKQGLTGKGVKIALIDTGIDYLHTMFGGPGSGYEKNDPTIVGDVPNFPGRKVVGGWDFVGDNYDATPTSSTYQPLPAPDPDPMDCYSFGHGTHVAGTAAGYGVATDGATYNGPYNRKMDLSGLRIGPGVAPEASIYMLKVFGCTGSSDVVDQALEWAVDPNQDGDFSDHVDVINLSLGSSFGASFDATTVAAENAARLGIIVVASAGNTGDVHYAVGSPGMATGAISVAATNIDSSDPNHFTDGGVAAFSSRARRGDDFLKPDIAAPGVNVVSAKRGSGNQGTTSSGTSMASPVVAGSMALLRQAHAESGAPGWSNYELKALAMNTVSFPLTESVNSTADSLIRVGAGRIDVVNALKNHLIAFDADMPEAVSVNFGLVEVLDTATALRTIQLTNKSATAISVTVGYTDVRQLPGVTIAVGVGKVITIAGFGSATTVVTLTATAAAMERRPDPTRNLTPNDSQPWVDEASGYVSFTPVITTSGPAIHLPILALPRTESALTALSAPIALGRVVTASYALTFAGQGITGGVAPTVSVPLVGVFSLGYNSPPLTKIPNGDPVLDRYAQADLRYIGTAGPIEVDGEPMLYFALVSYGRWSSPLEMTYQMAIDINNDDVVDYRLENLESTDVSPIDFGSSDDFSSILEPVGALRSLQGPLNIYPSTRYDTRPFDNNVMILPLHLKDLGDDLSAIRYQVTSTIRDIMGTVIPQPIEQTPFVSLRVDEGAGMTTSKGLPLFSALPGDSVTITFNRLAYTHQNSKGVLLLYLHNGVTAATQVLPVQNQPINIQFLPKISKNSR